MAAFCCLFMICGCSDTRKKTAETELYNPQFPAWNSPYESDSLVADTRRYIRLLIGALPDGLKVVAPGGESAGFGCNAFVEAAIIGHELPLMVTVDKASVLRRLEGELVGNVLPKSAIRSGPLPWTQEDVSDLAREISELLYSEISKWTLSLHRVQGNVKDDTRYDFHFYTSPK